MIRHKGQVLAPTVNENAVGRKRYQALAESSSHSVRRAIVAVMLLLISSAWQTVTAQESNAVAAAKKNISICMQSVEHGLSLLHSYGGEDACILVETWRCVRENKPLGEPPEAMMSSCGAVELKAWQQLLERAYDSAVREISKQDVDLKSQEPARPVFEAAHKAWEEWAKLECNYQYMASLAGTARAYAGQWCMIVLTARRVFYYRVPVIGVP